MALKSIIHEPASQTMRIGAYTTTRCLTNMTIQLKKRNVKAIS